MAWLDRLATWVDDRLQSHPALDQWLERHLHAVGLHGPVVRHILKTRLVPAAVLVAAAVLLLIVTAAIRRAGRSRVRRRGAATEAS